MKNPPVNIDAAETALFLDVDGTLLDIEDDPKAVSARPDLIAMLESAADSVDGALALVSGRGLAEIDRIFTPARFPAAGAHGSEIRLDGKTLTMESVSDIPEPVIGSLEDFADANEGLLLERKATGVSLHYRRAPDLEAVCRALVSDILDDLGPEFRLIDGKMVLEIAPRAHSKGEAIRTMLRHDPFRNRRPVFVGDDVTDEDGFAVVNELGGLSIRVGDLDASEARCSLTDVDAVRRWLADTFVSGD